MPKILVVEDMKIVRENLVDILSLNDYEVYQQKMELKD